MIGLIHAINELLKTKQKIPIPSICFSIKKGVFVLRHLRVMKKVYDPGNNPT